MIDVVLFPFELFLIVAAGCVIPYIDRKIRKACGYYNLSLSLSILDRSILLEIHDGAYTFLYKGDICRWVFIELFFDVYMNEIKKNLVFVTITAFYF